MLSAHMNETCTDAASHFSEQLLLMPGSINCYPFQYDTDLPTGHFDRSSLGVSPNSIVFFSGANFFKIVPEISLVWARILAAVPNSVLVLMPYNPNWAAHYRTLPFTLRLNRQLLAAGVASDRLRILNAVPTRADLQQIVAAADIYLDAYPFAGACSMLDPMVVGTPPVVRTGPVGRSQHGAALMRMAGLEEVICTSDEEYIATAIDLASNPARRQKIRSTLLSYKATGVPEYFDTEKFSKKVGDALIDIHETYLSRYSKFEHADRGARGDSLRQLARSVAGHNLELAAMNDIGIVHSLIVPYFQHQPVARQRHMIDVGSCYGVMADPFLAIDWTADMFEPDPSPRPKLEQNVLKYGGRGRVFAIAVTDTSRTEIEFHRSYDGLSGLGESPFQSTAAIIKVPCTSLANFYVDQGVKFVDFLKIDAEGFDFNVLRSHNFNAMKPSLVMVEYGTHFESEAVPIVNQAIDDMAKAGYGVVVFNYDDDGKFLKGDFTYRLTDIWVDEHLPDLGRVMFGNLLFYRSEDDDLLLNLYSLLDNCRPRSTVSAH